MKKNYFFRWMIQILTICFFTSNIAAQIPDHIKVIRPQEIDDVLINPGIGFTSFQMFNGDNHRANQDVLREVDLERYKNSPDSLDNINQPGSSIAYFRIQWSAVEPEMGQYRWDYIDSLLILARQHGQTLALRISPYKGRPIDDVPKWYREIVGPEREFKHHKWPVDPEDPNYAYFFGNMARSMGERFDGHPDLESIDVSYVGWAGEGAGSGLLSDKTIKALSDPFIESFQRTPLIVLLESKKANEYIKSRTNIGWRQDCLGDLGFWADEQNGWTHMFDYYPQTIIEFGMQDAWETGHVTFEICGVFQTWKDREGYSTDQVKYIIDQSLKWHISSFNGKSSEVPEEWRPIIDEWLKKMGYRFVLRRFTYPKEVSINGKMNFTTWWENKGVAPCYKKYTLALKIKNSEHELIFPTKADITKWLPGDNIFDDAVFIPSDFTPGIYDIQIAIVDPLSRLPKIKLAIEGRKDDGWYDLGKVNVVR